MNAKEITFLDYLEEVHGEDYTGTDDNMPDDFYETFLPNLSYKELMNYYDLFINSEYTSKEDKEKFITYIKNQYDN